MYNIKNMLVIASGTKSGDSSVDLPRQGWELVIYNHSGNTLTLVVHNLTLQVPNDAVMDEAFVPFDSFEISGSVGGDWDWYIRG